MAALTTTAPDRTGRDLADLNHFYCCDPDRALCGADISDQAETDDDVDCVVCVDLEDAICPTCGE